MQRPHLPILGVALGAVLLVSPSEFTSAKQKTTVKAAGAAEELKQGIVLYQQGQYQEAEKLLKVAVDKNRQDADAWSYLGLTLLAQRGQAKNASKAFEAAIKLRPDSATAHAGLALALLIRNKMDEAVLEANKALSLDPKMPDPHYVLGIKYMREGIKSKALEEANAALQLNSSFAAAYLLKSEALVSFLYGDALQSYASGESPEETRGRYKEAAAALEKYIQLSPKSGLLKTLSEQLESLRFYSGDSEERKHVYAGREVSVRAKVTSKPEPLYTQAARENGTSGIVIIRAVFSSDGTVKHIVVMKGLPDGLTEAAVRAARQIKFIPATIDGLPASQWVQLEYNFYVY
jgi:TonB family protein